MADDVDDKRDSLLEAAKADYDSVPRTTEDLAERLANGNASSQVLSTSDAGAELQRRAEAEDEGRDYRVEDNETDGYVGAINPEYVTYANETEKPFQSEGGPEKELEEQVAKFREGLALPGVAGTPEEDYKDKQKAAEEATEDAKSKFPDEEDSSEESSSSSSSTSPSTTVASGGTGKPSSASSVGKPS